MAFVNKVEIIFMCGEKGANKRGSARKGLQLRDAFDHN